MALSFYKLHLAASSALVVDRAKKENQTICADVSRMEEISRSLLNRNCGAGGRALVSLDNSWPVLARAFGPNGTEVSQKEDAWLCAARLAFDAGRARSRSVVLACPDGQRQYEALASGTLATSLEARPGQRDEQWSQGDESLSTRMLLADVDRARGVRLIPVQTRYRSLLVVLSPAQGPSPRKLALSMSGATGGRSKAGDTRESRGIPPLIWVQVKGRELVRFLSPLRMERLEAAVAAARAAAMAGLAADSLVAEWAGPCGAVRYGTLTDNSPRELVTRGRFWARIEDEQRILIAGSPEYAFEGSFERD